MTAEVFLEAINYCISCQGPVDSKMFMERFNISRRGADRFIWTVFFFSKSI